LSKPKRSQSEAVVGSAIEGPMTWRHTKVDRTIKVVFPVRLEKPRGSNDRAERRLVFQENCDQEKDFNRKLVKSERHVADKDQGASKDFQSSEVHVQ